MTITRDNGELVAASPAVLERPGPVPRRERRGSGLLRWGVTPFLVGSDVAAVVVGATAALVSTGVTALFVVFVVIANASAGLYRSRLSLSVLDDSPALVGRGLAAAALATAVQILAGGHPGDGMMIAAGVFAIALILLRAAAYVVVRSVRRARYVSHRTLVIGAGQVGGRIVSVLLEHPEYGLAPVGYLDSDPLLPASKRRVPLLGGHDDLAAVIQRHGIGEVILAFGSERESGMVDILRTCDRLQCEIFVVPRLFEMSHAGGQAAETMWGVPLVRMRRAAFRSPSWRLKRCFDVVVAGLAVVVFSPFIALIALAVRLESGRGVLFRQERVGLDGRPFRLLKFRSLRPETPDEAATRWSLLHDNRIGPVGRFLRRTSLDELPQLWNVLVGDMSLVGPRPERPYFVAQFADRLPRYMHRHRVPAGMTGWAQVHGLRGDTSIEDRARFDNYYIENWSLWLDIKILLRTTVSLLHRTG